jgi:hypothetical protein
MKEKIKLTELTKDELRQVRGGIAGEMGIVKTKCGGKEGCAKVNQNMFGYESSNGGGTILSPKPIMKPIVKP